MKEIPRSKVPKQKFCEYCNVNFYPKNQKRKYCKTCEYWLPLLEHEIDEANTLSDFVGSMGLSQQYNEWATSTRKIRGKK